METRRRPRVLGLRRQALPELGPQRGRGKTKEEFSPEPLPVLARCGPAATTPKARLEDMDRAGILASLCFPTITRFCGQLFMEASDREFGFECLQDLQRLADRGVVRRRPGSLHPADADPDVGPAARGRGDGAHGRPRASPRSPSPRTRRRSGCPTIHDKDRYWDPVMAAAQRARDGRVACTSARRRRCPRSRPTPRSWPTSPGAPSAPRARCCRGSSAACSSATRT